jgi:hypothetical protein
MIDASRLDLIVRENIEPLSRQFFPQGRKVGREWKIGNTTGERGDSLGIQLTGLKAGQWHDRATGEGGTFPSLLMAKGGLSFPDACRLISDFFGINLETDFVASASRPKTDAKRVPPTSKPEPSSMNDFDWTSAVHKFDPERQQQLGAERAFSTHTLAWLTDRGDIGALVVRGKLCIAFPVPGTNGQVIGAHYRWPEKNTKGKHDWFYTPEGLEIGPLVYGQLATAKQAFFFESYWDANALVDRLALCGLIDTGEIAVVCTRGADFGDRLTKISLLQGCVSFAFPQNDAAGEHWLDSVIAGLVREVRVVCTPPGFKDLNEWTRTGAHKTDLLAAIEVAEVSKPKAKQAQPEGNSEHRKEQRTGEQSSDGQSDTEEKPPLVDCIKGSTCVGEELAAVNLPPRAVIVDDWFKEGDLGYIYAFRGVGKTWHTLSLVIAISLGGACGPWQSLVSWPVLYIDGEMAWEDNVARIRGLNGDIPKNLHVLNHEVLFHRYGATLNLANWEAQEAVITMCLERNIKVLALDNLGCLFSGVSENDADDWEKILPWLLRLRRHRIAVIVIHHTGRNKQHMRGITKREDPAAWLIQLDEKDTNGEPGARFLSRFTKRRGHKLASDYDWYFQPDGSRVILTVQPANRADVVLQWVRDGLGSASKIAAEMGISEGAVSKLATQLIKEGKLKKSGRDYVIS